MFSTEPLGVEYYKRGGERGGRRRRWEREERGRERRERKGTLKDTFDIKHTCVCMTGVYVIRLEVPKTAIINTVCLPVQAIQSMSRCFRPTSSGSVSIQMYNMYTFMYVYTHFNSY